MNKVSNLILNTVYLIIASSTIIINKYLFIQDNISVLTITILQFISVFIGLFLCEKINIFSVKSIHLDVILIPALLFCCLVIFMNINLCYNSLITYQISKSLILPITICFRLFLYKDKHNFLTITSLIFIIIGSFLVFHNLKLQETIFVFIAILTTIIYEFIFSKKQAEFQASKLQLLFFYAPISSIFLAVISPIFTSPFEIFTYNLTILQLVLLIISCFLTVINNFISYWITTNSSILKYTILNQIKLIIIIISSWSIFNEIINLEQIMGISLTILGNIMYFYIKGKNIKLYTNYKRII